MINAWLNKPVALTNFRRSKLTILGRDYILVVNPFITIPIGPAKCGQHFLLFQSIESLYFLLSFLLIVVKY
jgi:hypothetical protein